MSEKQRHRRRRQSQGRFSGVVRAKIGSITAHPARALFAALLGFFLCWAVLTKSLPYGLAASQPDLALALNSNNPNALIGKAEETREKLLSIMGIEPQAKNQEDAQGPGEDIKAGTIAKLPQAGPDYQPQGLRQELRKQIRELAGRAIAHDPLNAAAYRLLAETTDNSARARSLMGEALKRSRRESVAAFWLLNDSYYRKDFSAAIGYADILLRTKPDIASYIMNYLANVARDRAGRGELAMRLAENPSWRRNFLASLWELLHKDPAALALVAELRTTKSPAVTGELSPYINYLAWNGAADTAYNLWLETLPPDRLDNLGLLTAPEFEAAPAGSATVFDWGIEPGVNASAEFVSAGQPGRRRLLHVAFGEGRIEFPVVRQVLLLPPGRYRLEGKLRGSIIGKRGLRWELVCDSAAQTRLGASDLLEGESEPWRLFTFEADVPQSTDCIGQVLRLFHDARSASEQYLSGEAWFAGMDLKPIPAQKNAAR